MSKKNYIPLFALFSVCVLVQCRTSQKTSKALDAEDAAEEIEADDEDADKVPTFLWSPARRRATSGYYFLVAEYMNLDGDMGNARAFFETSYNLDPNTFLAGKFIASQANTGQLDKALPEAKKMVLLYPKAAHLRYLYGQLLARKGFYKESVAELERSLELDPSSEEVYLELASIHQAAKQYSQAIVITKELVKKIPASVEGWSRLAKYYIATSQKKEALTPARTAYELQGTNPENVLVYALTLELNGDSKKAIALYEQLYRLNPTNEELIGRMIELYHSLGDIKESLALLDELSQLPGGDKPGVQIQRAIILWELKRYDDASALLEKLARDYPEHEKLQYMAGLGQEKLKKFEQALTTFAKISDSSQFGVHAKFRRAVILRELKRHDEALTLVGELKAADDADPDVYGLGGSIYAEQEKFEQAAKIMQEGYRRYPESTRLLFLRGVYEEKAGDLKSCIATMRQVIVLDPTNSSAFNYLGYLFAERGENLDEAEHLIQRALELKPDDAYYLDSLAWVYYQKKQFKVALKLLNKAQAIIKEEGVILEHLGDVHMALGEHAKALEYFERAVKTNLEKRDRGRVEDKLKKFRDKLDSKAKSKTT